MAMISANATGPDRTRAALLYHFCRMHLPVIRLPLADFDRHLRRTYQLHEHKTGPQASWAAYLDNLYPQDWFIASACVDGNGRAWEYLFAARAGRSDCLLMDALRARAARLYPRNEERQESAVTEFWSNLYAPPDRPGSLPILARYDGLRPLVPWLIRVFQNWHISELRSEAKTQALPDDDLSLPLPSQEPDQWHELFCQAARDWLGTLQERELLILGLRLRYRLSQREVAALLETHEGTISRRTDALSAQCKEVISQRLLSQGWLGDDLSDYIRTEMAHVLLDDPRLSVDYLAHLLAAQGKKLPA